MQMAAHHRNTAKRRRTPAPLLAVALVVSLCSLVEGAPAATAASCPSAGLHSSGSLPDVIATSCDTKGVKIEVAPFFRPDVPAPGDAQYMFVDEVAGSGHVYGIARDADGGVGVLVDGNSFGNASTTARMAARATQHVNESGPAAPLIVCGSSTSFTPMFAQGTTKRTRFANGKYIFYYNPASQPSTNSLAAIQGAFANVVADSSSCGSKPTSASWSYVTTTTKRGDVRDGVNVIAWDALPSGTLGLAGYFESAGATVEADIRLSSSVAWHTATTLPVAAGKFDLMSVAAHEIMHNFGLGHVTDSAQVMFGGFGTGPGNDRRTKRSGDLNGMATYNP